MLRSRKLLICLVLLGLFALAVPVVALANGGSAGDQQYTDPLGSQTTPPTTSTQSSPPPSTSTSSAPPSNTTPSASGSPTATSPTATIAASPSTTSTSTAGQLPYTGYDGRLAAGVGFVLVLGGVGLRRRARRA